MSPVMVGGVRQGTIVRWWLQAHRPQSGCAVIDVPFLITLFRLFAYEQTTSLSRFHYYGHLRKDCMRLTYLLHGWMSNAAVLMLARRTFRMRLHRSSCSEQIKWTAKLSSTYQRDRGHKSHTDWMLIYKMYNCTFKSNVQLCDGARWDIGDR